MTLAETASVFAETVVYDFLLERCETPREKLDILWDAARELPSFLLNIPARFEFEQALYEARGEKVLSAKEITAQLSKIADGGCSVVSTLEIDGKTAQLRSVYVYAEENFIGWPTVHYIDILGYSEDGQSVFERMPQSDRGRGLSPPDASLWHSGAKTWGRP